MVERWVGGEGYIETYSTHVCYTGETDLMIFFGRVHKLLKRSWKALRANSRRVSSKGKLP